MEGSSIRMTRTCKELDATGARARHCRAAWGWDIHTHPFRASSSWSRVVGGASHYLWLSISVYSMSPVFLSAMSAKSCPLFLRPRKRACRVRGHSATFLDTLYIAWWRLLPEPPQLRGHRRKVRAWWWLVRIDGGSSRAWRVDGEGEMGTCVACAFIPLFVLYKYVAAAGWSRLRYSMRSDEGLLGNGRRRQETALPVLRQIYNQVASELSMYG